MTTKTKAPKIKTLTYSTLFSGVKSKGGLWMHETTRDDATGWSGLVLGLSFAADYDYTGPNDRTLAQKIEGSVSASQADATLLSNMRDTLAQRPDLTEVPIDGFLSAWDFVSRAMSKDETRYNLCGVLLDGDKLVATDGQRLHLHPAPIPPIKDAILPADGGTVVANALGYARKVGATHFRMGRTAERLVFHVEAPTFRATISVRLTDGQFPAYTQVVPDYSKEEHVVLTGRVSELREALKTSPVEIEGKYKYLLLQVDSEGHVWACDRKWVPDLTFLPVEAEGRGEDGAKSLFPKPCKEKFNFPYITDLFCDSAVDTFTVQMGTMSPLVWWQGEAMGLVMPMRK
jgi:hypothetical protein